MSEDVQGIWGGFTVFGTLRLTGDPGFCRFSGVQRKGLWVAPNSAQKSLLFFFSLCFFFPQSLTWGALYSRAAAALYGVPSPQPFSPQSFQNAPSTSLKPVPPLLVQVPLLFSPLSPWHLPPFLFPISSASARPLLTFCPHALCCGISETEIQTVFLEILRWCLQTTGLCCIRIACTQEWKASFPQTCLLPK